MNPVELVRAFEQIGELLTPAAEKAFALALANIRALAVIDAILAVVCAGICAMMIVITVRIVRRDDCDPGPGAVFAGLGALVALIPTLILATDAILFTATPEYYAMMRLLEALGGR